MISIGPVQFDFSNPWLIALSTLLFVSLLLSTRAVYRRLFSRSPLRALAVLLLNTIAYGVVFLLLLEPRISHTGAQSVILLTQGADPQDHHLADTARLYVAPGVTASDVARRNLASADWLLDVGQLKLREPALGAIEIRGYGLEPDQWQNFSENIKIDFKPPAIDGFTTMRWQRSLPEGDILRVSGHYSLAGSDAIIELRLLDPAANTVAETRVKSGQYFSLATRVKTRGLHEYRLQAWRTDSLQAEQTVAFAADAGSRLNIMIEQSAPSFETRQLKNFAAANGHPVRINSDISTGKTINQSVNLPVDTDTTFSPQVLAGQDVLIMDGRAFTALPPIRKQWLTDAVENGLGLLLLADSALLEQFDEIETSLLDGFYLSPLAGIETTVIPRLLTDGTKDWQEPIPTAAMLLRADDADVLVDGSDGRNLVVKRATGLGQVGISLISHSHSWFTAGHRFEWSEYWSALLAALARQRDGSFLLPQAETDFYRVNQRTAICAFVADGNTSILVAAMGSPEQQATLELQPAADTLNSTRQCAYFWPHTSGWHLLQLRSKDDDAVVDKHAIYVFSDDQWLTQQRDRRVKATLERAAYSGVEPPASGETRVYEPIGLFWLWLTLVLSATFLWLERKLDFV